MKFSTYCSIMVAVFSAPHMSEKLVPWAIGAFMVLACVAAFTEDKRI